MQAIKNICHQLLSLTQKLQWLSPLLARLTLAAVFIESGWGKIHNIPKVVGFFTELGIPAPEFQAYLVSYTELIGGTLLLVGLFTRLASIPLSVTMIVAIITAKKDDMHEFTDLFGFSEYLYLVLFVYLIINGPGRLALDCWVKKHFLKAS